MKNQSAYLVAAQTIEIRDTPMPVMGDDEILLEMKHVGVCGSDVSIYTSFGSRPNLMSPIVLGHECAGVVVEVGKNVTSLKPGDLVAPEPGIPCMKCEFCLGGKYNLCRSVIFMAAGPFKTAALHRYITHPESFSFKLPEGMSTVEGAMVEPLAVGVHATNRSEVGPGDSVVILGMGTIGIMTLLACKARGVTNIVAVDLYDNRLEMATAKGAVLTVNSSKEDVEEAVNKWSSGKGSQYVFETAGNPTTAALTSKLVKHGGRVVMVGNIHGETSYNFLQMNGKEADILSVFRYRNVYPMTIEAISTGITPVQDLATSFFPFEQTNIAFDKALNDRQNQVKVIIEF